MRKKRLFMIILLVSVSLIVAGCRVRSASQGEPQEPTQVRDQLASNTTPTAEVLDGNVSPTATIPVLPTETFTPFPSPTLDGNTGVVTSPSPSVEVIVGVTEATDIPTTVPSLTPFATATYTATAFPTDTLTFTPTFTATITPLPSDTPLPSNTPIPSATPSFTPFPSLTPLPPTAIGQVGTEPPPQHMTATAIILTFEAQQGTFYPTWTPQGQGGPGATEAPVQFFTATPTLQGAPDCEHFISPGETLSQIARLYNMSTETLGNYNNITNIDLIEAGDTLNVPGCGRNPTPVPTATTDPLILAPQYDNTNGPIQYTVEQGDNIYRLSVKFGVTMSEILNANGIPLSDMNFIYVGDLLNIPRRSQTSGTATPTAIPAQVDTNAPSFPSPTPVPALPAG